MKPYSLNDPDLAALEAELLGQNPRLDSAAQQALLYQAAFQAGTAKAAKTTRLWQAYTGMLGLILAVTLFPWDRPSLTTPPNQNQPMPENIVFTIPAAPKEDLLLGSHGDKGNPPLALENWKSEEDTAELFNQALQKFAQLDPREKSYSLIQFSQQESLGH